MEIILLKRKVAVGGDSELLEKKCIFIVYINFLFSSHVSGIICIYILGLMAPSGIEQYSSFSKPFIC